jgi:hypothetical protein
MTSYHLVHPHLQPYHALYRHDFAAKSKPDVHKAWVVLVPWALLLYKSPAHMRHRPFMVRVYQNPKINEKLIKK